MSHHHAFPGRRSSALTALLVVAALLAVACSPSSSPTPSSVPSAAGPTPPPTASPATSAGASSGLPSASGDAAADAIYDTVETQVEAIRGLHAKQKVAREFIDATQLRTILTQEFDHDSPPAYVEANERFYKALGLIPADASLRTLSLDLLSGGVEGFYRNDEKKLYVVSKTGGPGPVERFYFAHEFDHALQDQNSTIFSDVNGVLDQSDRVLARAAIYEGAATLLMTQWAEVNLEPSELLAVIAASSDPTAQAVFARTPPILAEPLTYPYTTGLSYVMQVQSTGGWAGVNAYFTKMPASTEQILHPEKYTAGEAPVAVTMPSDLAARLGTGWKVPFQDTFGELQFGIWLRGAGVATATATAAAAGWGGDRLAVMEGPNGTWAVAMHTVWDTDADAAEFDSAATVALAKAQGTAKVLPGAGGKTRWVVVAGDATTLGRVAGVLGLAG